MYCVIPLLVDRISLPLDTLDNSITPSTHLCLCCYSLVTQPRPRTLAMLNERYSRVSEDRQPQRLSLTRPSLSITHPPKAPRRLNAAKSNPTTLRSQLHTTLEITHTWARVQSVFGAVTCCQPLLTPGSIFLSLKALSMG